jgi:hypothetical protein
MPKSYRRTQLNTRNRVVQKMGEQNVQTPTPKRSQPGAQVYDASKYVKRDLLWSSITAGIVVVVMVLLYIFFR